jgi:hypothetical protein
MKLCDSKRVLAYAQCISRRDHATLQFFHKLPLMKMLNRMCCAVDFRTLPGNFPI